MSLTSMDSSLPIIGGGGCGILIPVTFFVELSHHPTEIVEEGRTYDLDVDELQDRINLHNPTLFYIYYQQDGTRGSHMKSLGDHMVPDLTSPRWDNFTPPPRSFRSRRVVSNRDDRCYFTVHPIRSINIHVLDRWREMYERDDPEGIGYESFCVRE